MIYPNTSPRFGNHVESCWILRRHLIGPNNKTAILTLANPVAVGGDFFEAENTTTGGQKAAKAVANVIGIIGGVGTNSTKRMSFTARPGTYVPGATQAAADANSLLVTQPAALR